MKKCIVFVFLFVVFNLYITRVCKADTEVDKQTFIYSVKGNDTLRLDKYEVFPDMMNKPCVIFVFGGGFKGGARDEDYNASYMRNLARSGYTAVAIDYRLGLRDFRQVEDTGPMEIVRLLGNSILMAVEDLFEATRFVYEHADEWKIDKTKIVANGSSAGAVTVLQAEYMICNKAELTKLLPLNFCYGGVIAFAGAVFSENGDLKWPSKPVPIQMFHGDADRNVPYDKIEMYNTGIYGSKHIAAQLDSLQSPYYFYNVINAAHEIAGNPMSENLEEIKSFIDRFVIKQEKLTIRLDVREIGKPEVKKDFTIMDYIITNYQ